MLQQERLRKHYDDFCDNAQPCPIISFLIFQDGDGGCPRGSTLFLPSLTDGLQVMDEVSPIQKQKMKLSLDDLAKQLWAIFTVLLLHSDTLPAPKQQYF